MILRSGAAAHDEFIYRPPHTEPPFALVRRACRCTTPCATSTPRSGGTIRTVDAGPNRQCRGEPPPRLRSPAKRFVAARLGAAALWSP
jgi:hypothetical protein